MGMYNAEKFEIEMLSDYAVAKERLFVAVRNAKGYGNHMDYLVCDKKLDLMIIAFVDIGYGKAAAVNEIMARGWGVDSDSIFNEALANTMKKASVQYMSLPFGDLLEDGEEPPEGIMVVTNNTGTNGAAVAFYPGEAERISNKIGGDYYLLPASIHEMIAIYDDGTKDAQALADMVSSINCMECVGEAYLSDHVYRYDAETKELKIAA